jgi:hypothetical protein
MIKFEYVYYVSYAQQKDGNSGFAAAYSTRNHRLNSICRVENLSKEFEEQFNLDGVIVLNWKLLRVKVRFGK